MDQIPISIVVIAKNEEENLPGCLESVRWAKDVVVVNGESSDRTRDIAKGYTSKVFTRRLDTEGQHRNYALEQATENWILNLDADERVSQPLAEELKEVVAQNNPALSGYAIPIRTYIGRRWIKAAGYYPATRLRLFRRNSFRFEESGVHPRVFLKGRRAFLRGEIIHYGYRDFAHFIDKLNHQTTLEAEKWIQDRRRIGGVKIVYKMVDRFSRNYFRKKGITDGFLGMIMSVFHSTYQFFTYAKYLEIKQRGRTE